MKRIKTWSLEVHCLSSEAPYFSSWGAENQHEKLVSKIKSLVSHWALCQDVFSQSLASATRERFCSSPFHSTLSTIFDWNLFDALNSSYHFAGQTLLAMSLRSHSFVVGRESSRLIYNNPNTLVKSGIGNAWNLFSESTGGADVLSLKLLTRLSMERRGAWPDLAVSRAWV